jgi:hypothetical protein
MQDITLGWHELTAIGSALVALAGGAIKWTHKIMQGEVTHWKDAYDAKTKELADFLIKPDKAAADYIDLYKQAISGQIADLEKAVASLKTELSTKEEEIVSLKEENERDLIFAVEMQEKLEREITAYEDFIGKFMGQSAFADQVTTAFSRGEFDISKLEEDASRLQDKLTDITAASYRRFREHLQGNLTRAEAQKAAAVQLRLREKRAVAEQEKMRMKLAAPVPVSEKQRR